MERHNGAVFQEAGNSFLRLLGQQTVTIRNQSDNTLATIYSDDGVTPKANPFTSGSDGEFFFYAANGRYKIQIGNPVFETREDILLHDPGETRLPTFSTDEAVARFNGTTGNVQNSSNGPFVDDNGRVFTHPSNGAMLGGVVGILAKPPNDDLDDVTGVGWYLANSAANRPTGSGTWFVQTAGDINLRQIAYKFDDATIIYTRVRVSGVWGSWVQWPTVAGFQMTGALDFRAEQSVASAATVNLGAVAGNFVQITGTTAITSFGTAPAGTWRLVRFAGALTLTHNGTSLILPGSANITTAANDTLIARSLGSGNWFVSHYHRASGLSLAGSGELLGIVREKQTSGTNGGAFNSGAWRTRSLNNIAYNRNSILSLNNSGAGPGVVVPAGNYEAEWQAVAHAVGPHQTRLQDVTNTATLGTGLNCKSNGSASEGIGSEGFARFSLSGTATIEVQHRCTSNKATDGFGIATGWGDEIYCLLKLKRS